MESVAEFNCALDMKGPLGAFRAWVSALNLNKVEASAFVLLDGVSGSLRRN